jgi:gamma-glutamylaminecyclotransferase
MPDRVTLFVYGTLKRGCRNHSALRGAEYAGEARSEPDYMLVNCGSYPGLVRAGDGQHGMAIRGELYRVDETLLAVLDQFEKEGNEYVRKTIRLADGSEAQTYLYLLPVTGLEVCGTEWVE